MISSDREADNTSNLLMPLLHTSQMEESIDET